MRRSAAVEFLGLELAALPTAAQGTEEDQCRAR
ncbi:MAG: hypothetical protein AVDCRST_MAG34-2368 [uncultured Nocardioidaceae bacterium]|uniref:Uncharacterized protein n=1 Tax=uncultured Nocardioidaceae bacterium TaxID=253824 RepID=A0A6J4MJB0_9ACTN|nr:MAG: hypothetical protein AVDCRST_MAG34-2368 [uncultured Nocardioidaceae bacterium]